MINRTEGGQIPSYPEKSSEEPTTPVLNKTKRVAEERFSDSESTSEKKIKISSQKGPFLKDKPLTFEGADFNDEVNGYFTVGNRAVEVRSYEGGFLVTQQSLKGCGGACVLMLTLDKTGGDKPSITHEPEIFWDMIMHVSLLKLDDLLILLKKAGIAAEERSYYKDDYEENEFAVLVNNPKEAMDDIRQTIRNNGKPMIVGICHPDLYGHWIIIDSVTDQHVSVRDPFTGMAFKCLRKEIEPMILNEVDKEACVALL